MIFFRAAQYLNIVNIVVDHVVGLKVYTVMDARRMVPPDLKNIDLIILKSLFNHV